jgi:hypothetical protein
LPLVVLRLVILAISKCVPCPAASVDGAARGRGDGVLHRTIVRVQRLYFDPPDIDGRMPRVSKWER